MLFAAVYFGFLPYGAGSALYGDASSVVGDCDALPVGAAFVGSKNSRFATVSLGLPYLGYGLGILTLHASAVYSFEKFGGRKFRVGLSFLRYSHKLISESTIGLSGAVAFGRASSPFWVGSTLKLIVVSLGSDEYVALDPSLSPGSVLSPTFSVSMGYSKNGSSAFIKVDNIYPANVGFYSDYRLPLSVVGAASVRKERLLLYGSVSYYSPYIKFRAGLDYSVLSWASFGMSTSGGDVSVGVYLKYVRYSAVLDFAGVGGSSHYLSLFYSF